MKIRGEMRSRGEMRERKPGGENLVNKPNFHERGRNNRTEQDRREQDGAGRKTEREGGFR